MKQLYFILFVTVILNLNFLQAAESNLNTEKQDSFNEIAQQIYQDYLEYENQGEFDDECENEENEIGSWSDKIKAAKCLMNAGAELNQMIQLYHDIIHFKIFDGLKLILPLLEKIKPILKNCDVFFCMGPSITKCEQQEQTTCSQYHLRAYPDCKEGWTNHGCCKCWPACPEGWKSFDRMCIKPKDYWRGTGYPLWDKKKCQRKHPQGCEQDGLLIYPKCKEGYHSHLFSWCSPDCPEGYFHLLHSCLRPFKHYKRGHGYPMTVGEKCLGKIQIDDQADCEQITKEFIILQQDFDKSYEQFIHQSQNEKERYLLIDTELFILMEDLAARYIFIQEHKCTSQDSLFYI